MNFRTENVAANAYSEEELDLLYSLGVFYIEVGQYRSAENILIGLFQIDQNNYNVAQALASCYFLLGELDLARQYSDSAVKLRPDSYQVNLLHISILLSQNELSDAGSLLGSIGDQIERGELINSDLIRFYRSQVSRFQVLQNQA